MRIISYNVNGLRSAISKGFLEWLQASNPDVLCLQEIKARKEQIDLSLFEKLGYNLYWMEAEKNGYSGVAIFCKQKPINIANGCNISRYDCEGRVLRIDYESFSIMSVYMPSGSMGEIRQTFKIEWLKDFKEYIQKLILEKPSLIICGDFNICHKPIDIHNPFSNKNSSGFLPEEREWITEFLNLGFIDSFRFLNPEPHNYTWWSFRTAARQRNLGWRIDYQIVSLSLKEKIRRALILKEAYHSDHCPTLVEIDV